MWWPTDLGRVRLPMTAFRVWAPLAHRVRVRARRRGYEMPPIGDGWRVTSLDAAPGTDYALPARRGRHPRCPTRGRAGSPTACTGRAGSTTTRPTRGRTTRGRRAPAPVDRLRAARRHVHAGGHVRRRDRAARPPRRARRRPTSSCCRSTRSTARGTGATTASAGTRVHEPYGGPDGLKRFVDACHARGLGVCSTSSTTTSARPATTCRGSGRTSRTGTQRRGATPVNLDGPGSDEVRRYIIDNALHVAARLPRRRSAAGRRARARRHSRQHLLAELAARRSTRCARTLRPAADAHRRVRPERPDA